MASDLASSQGGNPTPSRKGLYIPFILLALVILGWTVFWYVAAFRVEKVVDAFAVREMERGRFWKCPNRNVSGYPFRLQVNCDNPQLTEMREGESQHEASLGGLALHARILSPGHYIAEFKPPFRYLNLQQGEAEINWQGARASFRGSVKSLADLSLEMTGVVSSLGIGENKDIRALAKEVGFHLRQSPGEIPGTDVALRVADFTFAPLDQLTGNPEPLKLELQATAPGLVIDTSHKFVETMETWRNGGGKARVVLAKATKGNASLDLSGPISLDAQRRPEGSLQGRAKGLDALTGRFTRATGLDIGGLLGKISGNQGLPVALTIQNGLVRFGPFQLAEVPPLY